MTESAIDLKPCPFCGGPGKLKSYISWHAVPALDVDLHYVECERCDIQLGNEETPEKAAEKWNKRPADEDRPSAPFPPSFAYEVDAVIEDIREYIPSGAGSDDPADQDGKS